jgi:hypothetical protein
LETWPPDLFAITSLILRESGAYRLAASPPRRCKLPTNRDWKDRIAQNAEQWRKWLVTRSRRLYPERLNALKKGFLEALSLSLASLSSPDPVPKTHWESFCVLLELHALADQACEGLGIPSATPGVYRDYFYEANTLLSDTGSLSRFHSSRIRVLPKLRTPQVGITLRSLSHFVCIDDSGVDVEWLTHPVRCPDVDTSPEEEEQLNLLALPWPMSLDERAFRAVKEPPPSLPSETFGFFELDLKSNVRQSFFQRLISAARKEVRSVHGVVLPESALTERQADHLQEILGSLGVPLLLTGVRGQGKNFARLGFPRTDRRTDGVPEPPLAYLENYPQHKHHRWRVERRQIDQYDIAKALSPELIWWEDIHIHPRALRFLCVNSWLTLCHLICEDLARLEPVGSLIRAVGPTLVIALLQDGPQLEERWPGRYATVLAEDPGSSVLTLTSLGMALRSKPRDPRRDARRPTVALWKDPLTGTTQLNLNREADALLLKLRVKRDLEWTADGRPADKGSAGSAVLVLDNYEQIRA